MSQLPRTLLLLVLVLLLLLAVAAVRVHAACDVYTYTDDATPDCALCHVDEDACTAKCHPFSNAALASWPMQDNTTASNKIHDALGRYPLSMYGNVFRTSTGPGVVCDPGAALPIPFGLATSELAFTDLRDEITSNQHYSLEIWVLRRNSPIVDGFRRLFQWARTPGTDPTSTFVSLLYWADQADLTPRIWAGGEGGQVYFNNAPLPEDELSHVVMTVSMPETFPGLMHLSIYKNGVLQQEVDEQANGVWEPWPNPASHIAICSAYPNNDPAHFLDGTVYSTTLYGRLMTQEDVTLLYQAGKDALWACDDPALTLAKCADCSRARDRGDNVLVNVHVYALASAGAGVLAMLAGLAVVMRRRTASSTDGDNASSMDQAWFKGPEPTADRLSAISEITTATRTSDVGTGIAPIHPTDAMPLQPQRSKSAGNPRRGKRGGARGRSRGTSGQGQFRKTPAPEAVPVRNIVSMSSGMVSINSEQSPFFQECDDGL